MALRGGEREELGGLSGSPRRTFQSYLTEATSGERRYNVASSSVRVGASGPTNAAIRKIHPTQMTVGYREVARKRWRWRDADVTGKQDIHQRCVPVVLGPDASCYALDRHHWLCALTAEGVEDVPVVVVADLRDMDQATMWSELDRRGWCHPYDARGQRQNHCEIPASIAGLQDDPFRSLARALRDAGGYAKGLTYFSEFAWADFLRGCMRARDLDEDFDAAVKSALALTRGVAAVDLFQIWAPPIQNEIGNSRVQCFRQNGLRGDCGTRPTFALGPWRRRMPKG
jgi:hypothetical protein